MGHMRGKMEVKKVREKSLERKEYTQTQLDMGGYALELLWSSMALFLYHRGGLQKAKIIIMSTADPTEYAIRRSYSKAILHKLNHRSF